VVKGDWQSYDQKFVVTLMTAEMFCGRFGATASPTGMRLTASVAE